MYALHVYDDRHLTGVAYVSDERRARELVDLLDQPDRIVWLTRENGIAAARARRLKNKDSKRKRRLKQ